MSEADYTLWRGWFADAVERNRAVDNAEQTVPQFLNPVAASSGACGLLKMHGVEYWFDRTQPVADFAEVLRRGTAACSEAAALAVALALNRGAPFVELCIEEHVSDPTYSHVAAYVDGVRVDCYAEKSLVVESCSFMWRFGGAGWL